MQTDAADEDLVLDADTDVECDEDTLSASALATKLSQLRAALKASNKEKQDNLAGWQRAKADLVNFRRVSTEESNRRELRALERVIEAVIPTLDSFAGAMQEKSWQDVDERWRVGVERIATQLTNALTQLGVRPYGTVGDVFDPSLHDCMSVTSTDDAKLDHTVAQVLQKGYEIDGRVVRPAKVVVMQCNEKTGH